MRKIYLLLSMVVLLAACNNDKGAANDTDSPADHPETTDDPRPVDVPVDTSMVPRSDTNEASKFNFPEKKRQ